MRTIYDWVSEQADVDRDDIARVELDLPSVTVVLRDGAEIMLEGPVHPG
jgi:hypothetical protein